MVWQNLSTGQLKVLSANCNYFDSGHPKHLAQALDDCLGLWKLWKPDLICMQDYTNGEFRKLQSRLEESGYSGKLRAPNTVHSQIPLKIWEHQIFPDSKENGYFQADFLWQGHRIRCINVHLESFQFDRSQSLWHNAGQLRRGLQMHSDQADRVADLVGQSPYPVILCGDFNDVPNSYAYHRILGQMQDGFRCAGQGLAVTYLGRLPGLRIDYIFASREFEFTSYRQVDGPAFLDHRWILAELDWKKT